MKTCSTCGQPFNQKGFYTDKRASDGLSSRCKGCHDDSTRRWRKRNPEKYAATNWRCRKRNPEKYAELRRRWKKRNPEKWAAIQRRARLVREYGISSEEFDVRLNSQDGVCAICRETRPRLAVDHCHKTGKIRGLLCFNCNAALGLLKDDPKRLRSAIAYLRKSKS